MSVQASPALTAENAYDILDRVTNITYRAADGALVRTFSYAYDPDWLIMQKVTVGQVSPPATNAYDYDGLGRLVSADGVAYTFDLSGNRLTVQLMNSGTNELTNHSYSHNRLDGDLYDTAGNVTNMVRNSVTLALSWNTEDQLVSVSTNGTFAESYAYDPLGRRVSTTDGSGTVFHVYDGDECAADVDATGNPLRSYTWGPGSVQAVEEWTFSAQPTLYKRQFLGLVNDGTRAKPATRHRVFDRVLTSSVRRSPYRAI